MNRLKLSLGIVFLGSAVLAGNFMACGGGGGSATGTAGSTGSSGTTGTAGTSSAAGTTGAAGTASATNPDGSCVAMAYHRPKPTDPCMCQDSTPNVCPTIGCVDLQTDDDNCGTCGTKCGAMSSCAKGACGPAPTVITTIAGCSGLDLAVNNATVFVADEKAGTISKLNAPGTAPTAVITGEKQPTWLASNNANLYWYNKMTKTIRTAKATGGAASDVYVNTMPMAADAGMPPEVGGFVVTPDGATIYFAVGNNVYSLPTATPTSTPKLVATEDHGQPGALALNGTKNIVFPVASTVDFDAPVLNANPAQCGLPDKNNPDNADMTTCPRLGRSQGDLLMTFVEVVNGRAYWVSTTDVRTEVIGTMGTGYETLVTAANNISAATMTSDTIWFGSFDQNTEKSGMIQKAPAAVAAMAVQPTSMARGLAQPTSLVVDATKVYWSASDCTISSLPK